MKRYELFKLLVVYTIDMLFIGPSFSRVQSKF